MRIVLDDQRLQMIKIRPAHASTPGTQDLRVGPPDAHAESKRERTLHHPRKDSTDQAISRKLEIP
jgi:hypothetical protein